MVTMMMMMMMMMMTMMMVIGDDDDDDGDDDDDDGDDDGDGDGDGDDGDDDDDDDDGHGDSENSSRVTSQLFFSYSSRRSPAKYPGLGRLRYFIRSVMAASSRAQWQARNVPFDLLHGP